MKPLMAPLRLRSTGGEGHRKVTWLELFFDLIFVAAVSQVAEPLRGDYSIAGLVRFAPLFGLIWWAWAGHTSFSTRFDTDDVAQRLLTLVQMFAVAAMAANARDALDSRSSAGFAAAYAAVRFLLVAQYLRARSVPGAQSLASRYLAGHGFAAVLWLSSAFVDAPERFAIWAVAFVIDLGTPWLAVRHNVKVPPDAAHLPERFGLFTLILLGETVVAVMQGMESQEDWSPAAATSAFLGMGVSFLIWWWYFDGVSGASEQPVRTKREAVRFHLWSYAHFPLYLGIVVVGVGIQRIVVAASHATLTANDAVMLTSGAALLMFAMTLIEVSSAGRKPRHSPAGTAWGLALALAMLALGWVVKDSGSPVVMIVVMASVCTAQLVVSVSATMPPIAVRASRHHRVADAADA
jgi:low temperature requirement protein LtrA